MKRRSPHGERGLKYLLSDYILKRLSRSPHGERGLKYLGRVGIPCGDRRSPHGERGLKLQGYLEAIREEEVAPLTGSVD